MVRPAQSDQILFTFQALSRTQRWASLECGSENVGAARPKLARTFTPGRIATARPGSTCCGTVRPRISLKADGVALYSYYEELSLFPICQDAEDTDYSENINVQNNLNLTFGLTIHFVKLSFCG